MPVTLKGATSGDVTINAPAVAGTTSITLPAVSGGEFIVSNSSGNVGIGTNSPNGKLNVSGADSLRLFLLSGAATGIRCGTTSTTSVIEGVDNTGVASYQPLVIGGSNLDFNTSGTPKLRIASDGQLSAVVPGGSTLYPSYTARAWVNFNGTGTVAINGSGNVSSITDRGIGAYTVNFSTAMADANYSVSGMFKGDANGGQIIIDQTTDPATGGVQIQTRTQAGSLVDRNPVCVSLFR